MKGLGPGGAERLLVAAAGAHRHSDLELTCAYLLPWKRQLVADLETRGVTTTCLGVRDERDLRWALRLRRLLHDCPVDVLHAHSPYPAGIGRLVVRTLPAAIRPRLVYTLHNTWSSFAHPSRALCGWTMPMDDADLAVSAQVRSTLPARLAARTEVLVHGIDLEAVRAQSDRAGLRAELGIGTEEVLFGTVANLRAQKDYPNLLAAARLLKDRGVGVRLLSVGQGPLETQIRAEHVRLGLGDSVMLLGERHDAIRVMSACDGFVLASSNEGLPVALMEALALGLPIVATAVGGVPEAVADGESGILVPPRDPPALAHAITALVGDAPRRARMAAAARTEAARFDIARTVDRLESVYRELVRSGEPK